MNTLAGVTVPAAVIIIGMHPAVGRHGVDQRLVAGEVGLAREHVHGLRAGRARQQLHARTPITPALA